VSLIAKRNYYAHVASIYYYGNEVSVDG